METHQKQQVALALQQSNAVSEVPANPIEFRIIRDLGGSGFARIFRVDTNLGQFVAKFALQETTEVKAEAIAESDRCTSDGHAVQTANGSALLLEGVGLQQLASQNQIRVPRVICLPQAESHLLLTEFIPKSRPPIDFEESFGHRLARMHQSLTGRSYGWQTDNFLGATKQQNDWHTSWPDFWHQQRMSPQIEMAIKNNRCDLATLDLLSRLAEKMQCFLGTRTFQCSLVHGDLWSGNFWSDENGIPVIIDPACYYADPIAELGMISLFGGLGPRFQEAYFEIIPKIPETEITISIYRFYHLLNHLNLFGDHYLTQVQWEASNLLQQL